MRERTRKAWTTKEKAWRALPLFLSKTCRPQLSPLCFKTAEEGLKHAHRRLSSSRKPTRLSSSGQRVGSTPHLFPCPRWVQEVAHGATPQQGEGSGRWGREWGWSKAMDIHTGQGRTPESMTHQNYGKRHTQRGWVMERNKRWYLSGRFWFSLSQRSFCLQDQQMQMK